VTRVACLFVVFVVNNRRHESREDKQTGQCTPAAAAAAAASEITAAMKDALRSVTCIAIAPPPDICPPRVMVRVKGWVNSTAA